MGRLLTQPEVYAAVAAEAKRQVESGEFFDESAVKAAIAEVLGVEPATLPPIRLGPFPGASVNAYGVYPVIGLQPPEATATTDWQNALLNEALQPDVQAVLQDALHEHLRSGSRITDGGHDEAILRKALTAMPPGGLRDLLQHTVSLGQDRPAIDLPNVSDTLARMRVSDRRLLDEHRSILADHGQLIRQMTLWPPETRAAARRFLALSRQALSVQDGPAGTVETVADSAAQLGFWDRTGSQSRIDAYLDIVKSRELASALGADHGGVGARLPLFEISEFPEHRFEDYTDPSVGVFRMRRIPAYGTMPDAKVYVVPTTHGAIRIVADTAFGGPMVVEETRVDDERATPVDSPGDHVIAGREASVSLVKYGEDQWETSVFAYDGKTSFHVEVGAKLEGAMLDHFVEFVRQMVESAHY